jgi:hypothetical protein
MNRVNENSIIFSLLLLPKQVKYIFHYADLFQNNLCKKIQNYIFTKIEN